MTSDQRAEHRIAVAANSSTTACPLMPTYGPPGVQFVEGSGAELIDSQGKTYLDFLCGLAVTSLGHSHPAVTKAIQVQASKLLHVSNLFATEHNGPLAVAIDRVIGDGQPAGGQVFFCNSGAEANEAAIKLVRRNGRPGRYSIISALGSFHGRTLATLAATGQSSKWEGFSPLPEGFRHAPWGDLAEIEKLIDVDTAAIMVEPVQGEGGVHPATADYLTGIRQLCDVHGLLFVVDEVQTGFARTGRWFGFQHAGIAPDVVTMAKALGNGVPIGACWARTDVAAAFRPGDHATTFGGQPLATAAARAVLDELERMNAPVAASERGAYLANGLSGLDGVRAVRGLGLLVAAELVKGNAHAVVARCLEAGLILNAVSPTALRLAPPVIVTEPQIDTALEQIQAAIRTVDNQE